MQLDAHAVRVAEEDLTHLGVGDVVRHRDDVCGGEARRDLLVPRRGEGDVVDRRAGHREPDARRVRLVGRTLGDVDARGAAELEPMARKRQRRTVAALESEHIAVEGRRRLQVVRQHEDVVESLEHHEARAAA